MTRLFKRPINNLIEKLAQRTAEATAQSTAASVGPLLEQLAVQAAQTASQNTATSLESIVEQLASQIAEAFSQNLTIYLTPLLEQLWERMAKRLTDRIYYIARMEKLLQTAPQGTPDQIFRGVGDDYWLWLNTEGCRLSSELRLLLPSLPQNKELEFAVGTMKGDTNLIHGMKVYQAYKEIYKRHKGAMTPDDVFLDFGCGWGRVMRFFLKDLKPAGLFGVDPLPEFVEAAKQTNKWCHFELNEAHPPLSFPDGKFDLVYSYSVFSHLSEEVHLEWLPELARLLKPGGIIIASTMGRDHIEWCANLRKEPMPADADAETIHVRTHSATLYPDEEQAFADYDAGKYSHSTYAGFYLAGQPWGDTCLSEKYVRNHWTKYFTILEYIDDRAVCDQNVIVGRKVG